MRGCLLRVSRSHLLQHLLSENCTTILTELVKYQVPGIRIIRAGSPEKRREPSDVLSSVLLSHGLRRSTIGAGGLNYRVRNGIGCTPSAITTEHIRQLSSEYIQLSAPRGQHPECYIARSLLRMRSRPRPISTARLNTLLRLHLQPINLVVYEGPYLVNPVRDLIFGRASRLDAFSGYPGRT
jgi:hypothetical protein